ncbi:hypothetical protein JAAARDRAFT_135495 [Jaapia argillacea MUCL 33604]|uniref:Man(5)GlcNAc(2)-PP-dolichol translocation protein RFT1 n=1 Tax=Jaapia argillacea MUCL 33604 TaxID=933084 RepID=A0A067PI89_9AGAM|nr:hypothetical protein JAAARDRAFT_135495 [Jaapia argillacea MUCL 33604]
MAPSIFTGGVMSKRKADLQIIAKALDLDETGNRDDLQSRIKRHLEENQGILEDDPRFSGLYTKRRKSVQPPPRHVLSSDSPPMIASSSRIATDAPNVSSGPPSPTLTTSPTRTAQTISPAPPPNSRAAYTSYPASRMGDASFISRILPFSAPSKSLNQVIPQDDAFLRSGADTLLQIRMFLSNAQRLWSLTAVFELLYILFAIVPWQIVRRSLQYSPVTSPGIKIMYPPVTILKDPDFWRVLFHWSLTALLIPSLFGVLISFRPKTHPTPSPPPPPLSVPTPLERFGSKRFGDPTSPHQPSPDPVSLHLPSRTTTKPVSHPPSLPFDPLTASIIRLACQFGYPYPALGSHLHNGTIDVLGLKWRVLSASLGVAFAFAEAIAEAVPVYGRTASGTLCGSRHLSLRFVIVFVRIMDTPVCLCVAYDLLFFYPITASHLLSFNDAMVSQNQGSDTSKLWTASVASASLLMSLQISTRLVTFVVNQAVLRMTSPRAYGTAAIQFELLLGTILFLSREGVRNALLRASPRDKGITGDEKLKSGAEITSKAGTFTATSTTNLAFLPLLIGLPLSLVTCCLYYRHVSLETRNQPHFGTCIVLYGVAALVELASEPFHTRAMAELRTSVRVRAEGLGVVGKAVTSFSILFYDARQPDTSGSWTLLAYAMGQVAYATLVLAVYLAQYGVRGLWVSSSMSEVRGTPERLNTFDPELLRLSLTMTSQSVVKHFLTEGDKVMVSRISPLEDQGGYAVAVNYGSLLARMVFQPIEEAMRLFFSKTLAHSSIPTDSPHSSRVPNTPPLLQACKTLTNLLTIQIGLSAFLITFGSTYVEIALHILLPPRYLSTSAPRVLSAWIWYLPVLAINGGLEAFVSSVASTSDLNRQSWWMTLFSALYVASALLLYSFQLGDASLVFANIVNLSARILYTGNFVSRYFHSHGVGDHWRWSHVTLDWRSVVCLLISRVVMVESAAWLGVNEELETQGRHALFRAPILVHIGLGVVLALVCLGTWWHQSVRVIMLQRVKVE